MADGFEGLPVRDDEPGMGGDRGGEEEGQHETLVDILDFDSADQDREHDGKDETVLDAVGWGGLGLDDVDEGMEPGTEFTRWLTCSKSRIRSLSASSG